MSIGPYTGLDRSGNQVIDMYVVNVTTSGLPRSYVGKLAQVTWDHTNGPCLYVGDSQSSPISEIEKPNDGVLEGDYTDYVVSGAFREDDKFKFGLFDDARCSL